MMNRNIYIVLLLCIAFLHTSCVKEAVQDWGTLELSVSSDISVAETVRSAEILPETEYADYVIMLYSDEELVWKTSLDEFAADMSDEYKRIPAGEYVVCVENCSADEAEDGMGRPRYAGSESFTVVAGRTAEVAVVCRQVNAKVTLAYASDFKNHLNPAGLSVSDMNGRKVALDMDKMSESHETAQVMYFNVPDEVEAPLTYTLVAGDLASGKVMRYDVSFTVMKSKWNKVTMTISTVTGE